MGQAYSSKNAKIGAEIFTFNDNVQINIEKLYFDFILDTILRILNRNERKKAKLLEDHKNSQFVPKYIQREQLQEVMNVLGYESINKLKKLTDAQTADQEWSRVEDARDNTISETHKEVFQQLRSNKNAIKEELREVIAKFEQEDYRYIFKELRKISQVADVMLVRYFYPEFVRFLKDSHEELATLRQSEVKADFRKIRLNSIRSLKNFVRKGKDSRDRDEYLQKLMLRLDDDQRDIFNKLQLKDEETRKKIEELIELIEVLSKEDFEKDIVSKMKGVVDENGEVFIEKFKELARKNTMFTQSKDDSEIEAAFNDYINQLVDEFGLGESSGRRRFLTSLRLANLQYKQISLRPKILRIWKKFAFNKEQKQQELEKLLINEFKDVQIKDLEQEEKRKIQNAMRSNNWKAKIRLIVTLQNPLILQVDAEEKTDELIKGLKLNNAEGRRAFVSRGFDHIDISPVKKLWDDLELDPQKIAIFNIIEDQYEKDRRIRSVPQKYGFQKTTTERTRPQETTRTLQNEISESDYDAIIKRIHKFNDEQEMVKQRLIDAMKKEVKLTYDKSRQFAGEAIWENYGRQEHILGDEHKKLLLKILGEIKKITK